MGGISKAEGEESERLCGQEWETTVTEQLLHPTAH